MASSSSSSGAFDAIIPSASIFGASSSGTKHPPFDVFINHCGQDVKQTLASRIYKSLDATGLKVFLDKPELKYGDLLPKALEEAMDTATIGIAIFSEHYAESPWCLAELEYMVNNGKTIIPIFYKVDPSVLRWTVVGAEKTYIEAFRLHEEKNRYAPEALQRWKEALQEASLCIGPIIKSIDDEEKVVRDVVNRVKELKNTVPLDVAKHPVALDEVVQDFDDTISLQSAGCHVKIIGIWGMGGSGKTTLAKEIFNRRHSKMQWSSFLSDVRDAAGKDLLLEKQKTLLKDLDLKDERHENLDRGKQILKNRLSRSASVLIILDDVDRIDQLDALLPSKESFENKIGDQSLIMVTTRDKTVLQQWGISAIYQMKPLEAIHAKELFCWHAFKQIIPQQGFEDLVDKFLNACAGLPLSLKVLGGQLCGEPDREYWLQTFIMYSQIPHDDIANRLKVSYDALKKQEQQMFLDVACFFIGERSSAAIAAWNAEFHGLIGWKTLVNKCLVEEDEDGLIEMHDHLRDLGRVISKESAYRLWSPQQIIEILPKVQEPIRVRGVGSAVGDNCYEWQGKIIIKTNQEECSFAPWLGLKIFFGNGKFLSQEQSQLSKDLIWLQCTYFEHKNLPPCGLKNLRILDLSDSDSLKHLWAADADALLQLRELVIQRCKCFAGFPNSIGRLEKLQKVIIKDEYDEIGCDALIELPQEFCYLKSLEHLELRHCSNLSSLPSNFGKLTKLRHLNLSCCTNLEALPSNFGKLTELRDLYLLGCTKLEALPSNFGELTELRHLDLSGCTKLEALPDSFKKLTQLEYLSLEHCREVAIKSESNVFENMTKLRHLDLEGCAKLTELRLPQEFCYLKSLEHLDLRHCSNLSSLPSNFGKLTKLRILDLSDCTKLEALPCNFGELTELRYLNLRSCTKLEALPSNFGELTELRDLNLTCCTKLEALPDSFKKLTLLEYLSLEDCREVAIKSESNVFENMTKLRYLNLEGCEKLKDLRLPELVSLRDLRLKGTGVKELLGNIFHLTNLTNLVIGSEFLITLPTSVGSLSALTTLTINGCKELKSLPDSLEHLSFLRDLTIEDTGVKCLPKSLTHLQRLTIRSTPISELSFRSWGMLKSVDLRGTKVSNISIGGDSCPALETLDLSWNNDLRELETLPEKLKTLNIRHCDELEKIESLGNMRLLKELKITNCPKLMVIACHSETSIALKKIHLEECQKLETIEGLKNIKSLEKLKLHDCPELNGLAGLAELTSLRKIDLQNCHNLTNIEDLENTRSLEKFIISDCQKLEALPSLPEITSQQELQLERCHKLKTIKGLESIKSLRKLRIYDCQELDGFPGLGELSSLKEFVLIMCPKLKKMEGLGNMRSLETLIISDCLELESLPNLSEITSLEEFKLTELRHLDLSGCTKLEALPDSFKKLTQLEYLSLEHCREVAIKSESNVFENMTKLRHLDLEGCAKLTEVRLPQEFCYLKSLEHLDLRHCSNLSSLPSNFGKLTKLRILDLSDCTKLEALPCNFGELTELRYLNLRSCTKLEALPSNFGELTELRDLNLTCCTKLEALPDSFKKLTLLEYLSLEDCREVAIKSESNVFENMTKLRYLNLEGCEKLKDLRLPELVSLRDLRLKGTGVKELLANIFHLTNLTNLVIGSEFLITLPTSVGSLSALTTLTINGCKELKSLPDSLEHLSFLRDLTIEDTGVKCLPKSLIHLQSLTIRSTPISELSFRSWGMLKSVDLRGTKVSNISIGGDSCPALETLDLSWNNDLRELETLPEKLKTLNIRHCDELEKIESLGNMRLLQELKITNCPKLMVIACHSETSIALKKVHLEECQKLETIEGLKNIKSLEKLKLHDCPELNGLAGLAELTSLRKIDLQNCHNLTNIEDLENTRSLEKFIISDCQKLEALPSLPEITSQQHLQLERCHKLKTIKGLESIKSLRKLRIYDCQELDGFPGLGELSSLKEFVLKMCPKLKKMEGLGNMRLEKLIISDCLELESLPNLSEITSLEEFKLKNCYKLEKIEGLERLRRLEKLKVHTRWNAPGIVSLEHSEKLRSLDVVANDISAVEPFVSNIQTWPSEVMICSRAVCDVGLLKNFFQYMPNVSVLDYAVVLKAYLWGERLELSLPERSAIADAILICFIIDSDHPDLRLSIRVSDDDEDLDLDCFTPQGDFNSELGEGKWVWMDVSTQRRRSVDYYYISACDSKGERVKVRVEAAWLARGEEGSIVEAFRQHFKRYQ